MKGRNPLAFRPGPVSFWTTAIYLAIVIPLIWVHETVPPAPSDHSLYRGLNLTEAWQDLQTISNTYHPFNSHENDVVREYLLNRTKEILSHNGVDYGVETIGGVQWDEILDSFDGSGSDESGSFVVKPPGATLFDDNISNVTYTVDLTGGIGANIGPDSWFGHYFEGNNFYVYIHGKEDPEGEWWRSESEYKKTHGKGGVLVNCHFDSVSTGYGATDDGMACVSLLQLLAYFTSAGRQPRYGIVLLFNNAEENGLYGAKAFGNSPLVQFTHTFVNLEGAAAGGRAMLFRTTDLETAKAYSGTPHPFGSVVAANAFEAGVIKSGTDYQVFVDSFGHRGLDIAFYAPRARYHTDEDDARHTSVNSIWHMLSAALASTEKLAETTGTAFHGRRSDGNENLVQNGKATRGVWFDLFGKAWATFALKGLFAWSLTLLVAAPLVLLAVTAILVKQNKYYYFARNVKIHSESNDDPVSLGGWKGFSRFPLALIFAAGLTIASVFLLAKFNPLIVYSSSYAVWAMTLSLFYFSFWLIARGSSVVRPTALHRGFVNIWLFSLGWCIQVVAAVAEDRWHFGALYFAAFLQSAVFLCLLISLLEQFGLPKKRAFALELHDAHHARDLAGHQGDAAVADEESSEHVQENEHESSEDEDEDEDSNAASPTEVTPLVAGEQGYGSSDQPTFANTYRQAASAVAASPMPIRRFAPYANEQSWSGRLPSWTWIIQFLLLAPVPVLLIGNLGLVATSSLGMTGTEGSSLRTPLLAIGVMSILLLIPLTPFLHRVTHHVPVFLLLVFTGAFIYNLVAFPFSTNHRFKFSFQQVIDLDEGTNLVKLTGLAEFVRPVVSSLPVAAGQTIDCHPTRVGGRGTLSDCVYDASSQSPNLVDGKRPEELMNVTIARSSDGATASVVIDALDTRTCYIDLSEPVYGFFVEGGAKRDGRFGSFPPQGLQHLQVWRRDWVTPWNVTLHLTPQGKIVEDGLQLIEESETFGSDELKARAIEGTELAEKPGSLNITIRCAYSDANKASTIPAYSELKKYQPTWSVATQKSVALVEVKKTYTLPAPA